MFHRNTSDLIEVTYDTDIAAKAVKLGVSSDDARVQRRTLSPSEGLMRAINDIRTTGGVDVEALSSLAMSASSLVAATSSVRRAKNVGRIPKRGIGVLKRSTERTTGMLAMTAATSAASKSI